MRRSFFLLLVTALLAAQATEVEITAEPHHHFAFANDQVRVFNVDVPPHTETLMHWHRHDYIYVTLGGAEVVNAVKGKDPVTIKLADGETRFTPATFAHVARNLSGQPFRNVTVELLQDGKLRQTPSKWKDDRGLDILHGGTAEILWVRDAVRATEVELQPNAAFSEGNRPPAQLLIAVSDVDFRAGAPGPALTPIHLASGGSLWIRAGQAQQLTNTGHAPAKFITLEFP